MSVDVSLAVPDAASALHPWQQHAVLVPSVFVFEILFVVGQHASRGLAFGPDEQAFFAHSFRNLER